VISNRFRIKKGVRQGCVLSPYLLNVLHEMVMRETLEGYQGGLLIGGRRISNLRYADDILLIATSEQELQVLVDRDNTVSNQYNLMINVDKTKVMATCKNKCNILINNEKLQQVDTFKYLGALITDDAQCTGDIHARLGNGTGNLKSMQRLWQSHDISIDTKVRLLKTNAWSAAIHGCEDWMSKKSDESRIEAFEMKGLKQILRVSWTARKTNEWILEKAGVTKTLLANIKTTNLRNFGHIMRHNCIDKKLS